MKKYISQIKKFRKEVAIQLEYAKGSVGFGQTPDIKRWRKDMVDYLEAISFCLDAGEHKLTEILLLDVPTPSPSTTVKKEESQERILCAANWYKELPLIKPEVLQPRGFAPYNIDKGVVLCGWRHPNCLYQKVAITGLSDSQSGENEQGFLTSKNRFVGREEALLIARSANQIIDESNVRGNRLHSEDLY